MDINEQIVKIAAGVARIDERTRSLATKADVHAAIKGHVSELPHRRPIDWGPLVRGGGKILLAVAGAIGAAAAFYLAL